MATLSPPVVFASNPMATESYPSDFAPFPTATELPPLDTAFIPAANEPLPLATGSTFGFPSSTLSLATKYLNFLFNCPTVAAS